ncbi:MAG TPA: TetR family transcriptional regulator [Gammaproteobacteria bacterium]|jgi:AcrR family transcriptional regulator|nr:TetR family transcriptional regulator [Gammaproteobacteria bacterium]
MVKHRAVTDVQKEARRAEILEVALRRFATTPYDSLSMAETADAAGVAKGTLYLYFQSKEELFLAICSEQLAAWFDEMDAGLRQTDDTSVAGFLKLLGDSLVSRPELLRLIAILHTKLEANVSPGTARDFRTWLEERRRATGLLLEQRAPFLKPGQGAVLLRQIDALVIGFQHQAEPLGGMREALAAPDMAAHRVDLRESLLRTINTLLTGLAYESKYGK